MSSSSSMRSRESRLRSLKQPSSPRRFRHEGHLGLSLESIHDQETRIKCLIGSTYITRPFFPFIVVYSCALRCSNPLPASHPRGQVDLPVVNSSNR
jgi:hypothetical protein